MKLEHINIIDSIQFAVDKICKQVYGHDTDSPPKFIVSQYDKLDKEGYSVGHEIILTIKHISSLLINYPLLKSLTDPLMLFVS